MSNVRVVLRKKPNGKGELPIAIRVTKDRKSIYYYTGKYIHPSRWDNTKRVVKKSKGINSTLFNNYLDKQKTKVLDEILKLESRDRDYSLLTLKRRLDNTSRNTSFF